MFLKQKKRLFLIYIHIRKCFFFEILDKKKYLNYYVLGGWLSNINIHKKTMDDFKKIKKYKHKIIKDLNKIDMLIFFEHEDFLNYLKKEDEKTTHIIENEILGIENRLYLLKDFFKNNKLNFPENELEEIYTDFLFSKLTAIKQYYYSQMKKF